MVRIGMIGLGGMGTYHSKTLAQLPDVTVVGVCDLIEEKARRVSEALGGVPWTTDYHDLLDQVDAVWVCTEPFNRVPIVTTCAAAGKHIFTEKPIALNLADADRMITAAEQAGVIYMVGYCLRFWNPFRLLRDTFVAGELGELVTCWTRRYMPCDMSNLWYGDQEKSGGALLDFGSHDVDWVSWIGGEVESAFGGVQQIRATMHSDEHGQGLLRFAGGGMGTVDISWWGGGLDESSIGVVGTKGAMIVGRDGKIRKRVGDAPAIEVAAEAAMSIDPGGNIGKKTEDGSIQAIRTTNETLHEHFIRCINEQAVPITTAREARRTLATVLAIQESARTGKAVEVAVVR